ncbi:uncharacterized protein [Aquarana catesbeiana]|uniref:uncharacterized protein isoform X2 n=1 Tax=Aquarana catesbeiana TaxID=8400 RepID=UPI003CC972B0
MPSPPSSQILSCLSFIIFLHIAMSEDYIHQVPERMSKAVGQSASIQCSVDKRIDIRGLSLYKRHSLIFTLWISSDTLSYTLEVSGTYNNFTWILNQDGGGTFPCTTASSAESPTVACRGPDEKDPNISLWNEVENVASFSVVSSLDYKSRIRLSGTLRNLTIWVTGLRESDRDCYTCHGTAEGIERDFKGNETCLIVVLTLLFQDLCNSPGMLSINFSTKQEAHAARR